MHYNFSQPEEQRRENVHLLQYLLKCSQNRICYFFRMSRNAITMASTFFNAVLEMKLEWNLSKRPLPEEMLIINSIL